MAIWEGKNGGKVSIDEMYIYAYRYNAFFVKE